MMSHTKNNWEPIDFTIYFSFIGSWVAIELIIELLFRLWVLSLGEGFLFDIQEIAMWAWRIAIFAVLGWRIVKSFGASPAVGVVAGTLSGVTIGLGVSLFRFIDGLKVWKFFNILTESVTIALVGALMVVLVIYIMSLIANFSHE